MKVVGGNIWKIIRSVAEKMWSAIQFLFSNEFIELISKVWDEIVKFFKDIKDKIKEFFKFIWEKVILKAVEFIKKIFITIWNFIK